jgi:hypothetical protein
MKKIILISGLALSLIATPALANCPSGICEVEINCTTSVVTYRDAPPRVAVVEPVRVEPIAPTHTVVVQTANSSFGTSGSYEQVQQALQELITAPKAPQPDPCALGGCTKVVVNATTKTTEILPLTPTEIQQRLVDQYMNYARQLEMAIAAKDAVIQTYSSPIIDEIIVASNPIETASAFMTTASTDTLWVSKDSEGNITTKKSKAVKVRSKKKK